MSDALTTNADLDRTSAEGQSDQASGEAQAQAEKQASKKVNLHELPEYREVQSKMDRERAQLQQALQREQQARVDMQRRLDAVEEKAAPDDYTRMELRLRRSQEQIAAYEAQLREAYEQQQAVAARENALNEIAQEFNVPRSELDGAEDYKTATKLAVAYLTNSKAEKAKAQEARREANRPDIGGGKTSTPSTRWEREYEEARQARDSAAMARLLRTQGR